MRRAVRPNIAVVDDDEAILDSIKLVLEARGWGVRLYATGETLLAALDAGEWPNCLVLEPHLPGLSGVEIARSIAEHDPQLAVVVLTARPTSMLVTELQRSGINGLLVKPTTAQQLISHIERALSEGANRL
jgi:two-component system response regulator FixJ